MYMYGKIAQYSRKQKSRAMNKLQHNFDGKTNARMALLDYVLAGYSFSIDSATYLLGQKGQLQHIQPTVNMGKLSQEMQPANLTAQSFLSALAARHIKIQGIYHTPETNTGVINRLFSGQRFTIADTQYQFALGSQGAHLQELTITIPSHGRLEYTAKDSLLRAEDLLNAIKNARITFDPHTAPRQLRPNLGKNWS